MSTDDTYDLATFALSDMARCGTALRLIGRGAVSMEEVANATVGYLYDHLVDEGGERNCALIRFFKTHPYALLDADQQRQVKTALGRKTASDDMKCLTLLSTAGAEPQWNSRTQSTGHQVIPLVSEELVSQAPMIARLITQFGLEVSAIVRPDAQFLVETDQRTYNVFYVPDALGSPFIPSQQQFVVPYDIRSVLGFGGMLPTGDLFAVILFSKVSIRAETTELFKTLALNVKLAILPFAAGPVFA